MEIWLKNLEEVKPGVRPLAPSTEFISETIAISKFIKRYDYRPSRCSDHLCVLEELRRGLQHGRGTEGSKAVIAESTRVEESQSIHVDGIRIETIVDVVSKRKYCER
ncbi:hypothetical protein EVAR_92705_1 [Eumeta japonica]|uniref:Uncharacterized protein n=1 Tax=Eumeta variegata TaxID=151549 RepID=A0A4C1SXU5_EUMVA|nr:hypothetical protein EVAR_92705_1 [Eumeta japonica]